MPRLTQASAPRPRRGITLVEVLITITVLAIVGATLSSILTRQQRFYRDASEQVVVRRELRGGSMLLPMDLRGVSTAGGDLLEATATQLAVRATIGSAVVCAKGATWLDLTPLGLATHTLTAWHTPPQVNDAVFVFNEGAKTGAEDDTWWEAVVASTTSDAAYCPATPFVPAAEAAKPKIRLELGAAVPPEVRVGAVVRLTRQVRYSLFQPSAASDWYLGYQEHDGTNWRATEAVAGPLTATSGARFVYFDTLGVLQTPTTALARTNVARVGVSMRAAGRTDALRARGGAAYMDSLNFQVGIRNFR